MVGFRTKMGWAQLAAIVLLLSVSAGPMPASAPAQVARYAWLHAGSVQLTSADVLTFAPDGLLFVGDSRASTVYALDVRDSGKAAPSDMRVPDIDDRIAARLGTTTRDLIFADMAVHPITHHVYFAVVRGRQSNGGTPFIVRVSNGGAIDVVDLSEVNFAKAELPHAAPADDASDAEGRNWTISDMAVIGKEIFVAGFSNEEFSSTLRRVALPFDGKVASVGLRMFHTHHGKFETASPASAITPYRVNGHDFLIAAYGCTPLVLFPVEELRDGARVTGRTIAELGAGQHVIDLLAFDTDGRRYLVANNSRRSMQMLDAADLSAAPALSEADRPAMTKGKPLGSWYHWGLPFGVVAIDGTLHLADFDADNAIAAQRDIQTGELNLRPLPKPLLWGQ